MELDRIKILVDKYLEAETTLDEERELAEYFATTTEIPEEYIPIKAMLNVVGAVKEQKAPEVARPDRSKRREWLMIGGIGSAVAAAACLVFMLMTPKIADSEIVIEPTPAPQPELVCHIDGVQITDRSVAYAEVNKILSGVSTNMQLAMAEVNKFNITNNR